MKIDFQEELRENTFTTASLAEIRRSCEHNKQRICWHKCFCRLYMYKKHFFINSWCVNLFSAVKKG